MRVVIDIPEHLVEACKDAVNFDMGDDFQLPANVVRAIAKGRSFDALVAGVESTETFHNTEDDAE